VPVSVASKYEIAPRALALCETRSMPSLVLVRGPHAGRVYPLSSGAVLGRDRTCEIQIREETLSRRHERFGIDENGWYVEDLESTNVRVNDFPVRHGPLREDDDVALPVR
jgi:FHA domain